MTNIEGPDEVFYEGLMVSSYSIGSLIGCFITLLIVRKLRSSRMMIRIIDLLTILAMFLCCITNFWTIFAGRALFGTVIGSGIVVIPLYFKEITPVEVYGIMSGLDKLLYSLTFYIKFFDRINNVSFGSSWFLED